MLLSPVEQPMNSSTTPRTIPYIHFQRRCLEIRRGGKGGGGGVLTDMLVTVVTEQVLLSVYCCSERARHEREEDSRDNRHSEMVAALHQQHDTALQVRPRSYTSTISIHVLGTTMLSGFPIADTRIPRGPGQTHPVCSILYMDTYQVLITD